MATAGSCTGDRQTNIVTFVLPVSGRTTLFGDDLGAITARWLAAVRTSPTELAVAKSVQAGPTVLARRVARLLGAVLARVCRLALAAREFTHGILRALEHVWVLQFQAYVDARAVVCPGAVVQGFGAAVGTTVEATETSFTFTLGLVSIQDTSAMGHFELLAA